MKTKCPRLVKSVCLAIILTGSLKAAFAQTGPLLPKVTPSSPTASTLQKYTDYPVSLNSGLVDVSIPLYTIESHGTSVPIALKYHASGIKYDDNCNGIGIGWTLFSGGMITGSVQGVIDNLGGLNNYFKSAGLINPNSSCNTPGSGGENSTLINFDKGYEDSEYDTYNFSFLNYQGKFFYPGTSTPVITPLQNMKIVRNGGVATAISSYSFDITDENGTLYRFGYYSNSSNLAKEVSFTDQGTCNYLLTEIVSADKSDIIRFNYTIRTDGLPGLSPASKLVITDQWTIKDGLNRWGTYQGSIDNNTKVYSGGHYMQNFTYAQLSSITFNNGSVALTYNSQNQLTALNVYNNVSSSPIKTVTLQQSNYGSDYYKLDQVNFFDNVLQKSYNYKLGYTGTPYAKMSGIDYWGFYNGTALGNDYVPNFQVAKDAEMTNAGSMDRTPNENAMLQGTLNKITYPTGGYSIFNFEAHRFGGGQVAGGLRIKKIDNYDSNGTYLFSKWYKYGQTENGDGISYAPINPADYCYSMLNVYTNTYSYAGTNTPGYNYTYNERIYGAFPKFSYSWAGSSVVYDYVTEYSGDGVNANGKTVSQFEIIKDDLANFQPYFYKYIPMVYRSNLWKSGNLLQKQVYNKTSSGYSLVSSVTNQYQDFNNHDYTCLKIIASIDWNTPGTTDNDKFMGLECFNDGDNPLQALHLPSIHAYTDYQLSTGSRLLISSNETTDGVNTTTQYTYHPTYLKTTKTTVSKSNGNSKLLEYTYPYDYAAAPYTTMVNANIIAPVIKQTAFKNDEAHFLSSTLTNYKDWGNNVYAPSSVETQKGTDASEARVVFDAYDNKSNIQSVSKSGAPKICYVYGYGGTYPIAEVSNADYATVVAALGGATAVQNFRDNQAPTDAAVNSFLAPLRTASGLSAAKISTYTYSPLVGMTSMTDVKGVTTYYEYDNFQRLKNIKNKDGNIVKHIDYHYQGQ